MSDPIIRTPDPAEAMRAKCQKVADDEADRCEKAANQPGMEKIPAMQDAIMGCARRVRAVANAIAALGSPTPDPAEAMRAKCEAIAREGEFAFDIDVWLNSTKKEMTARVALAIADAIAALKGNGGPG